MVALTSLDNSTLVSAPSLVLGATHLPLTSQCTLLLEQASRRAIHCPYWIRTLPFTGAAAQWASISIRRLGLYVRLRGVGARLLVHLTYAATCVRIATSDRTFANGPTAVKGSHEHTIANATNPCILASVLSPAQVVRRRLHVWTPWIDT